MGLPESMSENEDQVYSKLYLCFSRIVGALVLCWTIVLRDQAPFTTLSLVGCYEASVLTKARELRPIPTTSWIDIVTGKRKQ